MLRPSPNRTALWSKSAPNLDKTRTGAAAGPVANLTRPQQHDLGNASPTDSNRTISGGLQSIISTISDWRRAGAGRNNSFPINSASLITKTSGLGVLGRDHRLSKSIGNISGSHYDTVFSSDNFVIARGVSGSVDFGEQYVAIGKDGETERLISSDSNATIV